MSSHLLEGWPSCKFCVCATTLTLPWASRASLSQTRLLQLGYHHHVCGSQALSWPPPRVPKPRCHAKSLSNAISCFCLCQIFVLFFLSSLSSLLTMSSSSLCPLPCHFSKALSFMSFACHVCHVITSTFVINVLSSMTTPWQPCSSISLFDINDKGSTT